MDKRSNAAKPVDLRNEMPKVAGMVATRRTEWGKDHVNACIKAGIEGQPNQFYAFEGGHVIGTPFTREAAVMPDADLLRVAMLAGSAFMCMRQPKGE